jgi:hypothetical protein
MTPRPALGTATAALCAVLMLASCQGSPEAGRPNTIPVTPSAAPTPTPSKPSTPTWTLAEEAAITAAKARYVAARAAVGAALKRPPKATSSGLAAAGNGGDWAIAIAGQIDSWTKNGWYQTGDPKIVSLAVTSVSLNLEQPEVKLTSCIESTQVVVRFQSSGKPVPMQSGNGKRHRFQSRLVYAKSAEAGKKMWFLVDEKAVRTC